MPSGEHDSNAAGKRAIAPQPTISSVAYADDGLPFLVRGHLGKVAAPIVQLHDVGPALAAALPALAAPFQIEAANLVPVKVERDDLGMTHVRYAQQKNGLPVIGGDFVVHVASDQTIESVNGSVRDGGTLPVDARVSVDTAREIARGATLDGNVDTRPGELVYILDTIDGDVHLAWKVQVLGRDVLLDDLVFVDATHGVIVDRHPQVFTAKNREIRDGKNCVLGLGSPMCGQNLQVVGTEASPPSGDAVALAAHTNTGLTYDCYKALFNRDSYDNKGAKLTSLVHVRFGGFGGAPTGNNAAWSQGQMIYGDGDGSLFTPLANSLDVTAHELTHGVISATANLTYRNESGALNEGMADIMAAVCESWKDGAVSADTWLIGEDVFTPNTPNDGLRYMANPTADNNSKDYYPERYTGTQDNGGVHLNSGIPNLAFQLLVEGGKHPRNKTTFMVPGIGMEKAAAIFQRATTQGYFTSSTNMAQARTLTEMVAKQLYPGTETNVGLAWAAVGIGMPPQTPTDTKPPTISITSPANNATVAPGFAVAVTATDDIGVQRVELSIDGTAAGMDATAPYEFTTSTTLAPGAHTIKATAYDLVNQASASITVTVTLPPECVADGDCATGEVCVEGMCEPAPPACTTDDDCEGNEQCKDGMCVEPTGCSSDAECADGETCTGGVCTPPGGGETGEEGGCGCAAGQEGPGAAHLLLLLVCTMCIARRRRR